MYNRTFLFFLSLIIVFQMCCANEEDDIDAEVIRRYLSIEEELLNLLGLPEAPKTFDKAPIRKRSAPDYMYEIYQDQKTTQGKYNITELNRRISKQSDVIISFMAQNPHKGEGEKPDQVRRMWFDLLGVSHENSLRYGELRLYKTLDGVKRKHRRAHKIIIDRVYRDVFHQKQFDEVDSVVLPADFEGWVTLNITRCLHHWMHEPRENRGIRILTHPAEHERKRVKAENIGIIGFDGPEEKQPFITGFYNNINQNQIRLNTRENIRRTRRVRRSAARYSRRQTEVLSVDTFTHRQLRRKVSTYVGECKRKSHYIYFRDIKWHEWIIAPEGYDMHFCEGTCTFPLTTTANASNYAVVLSLYYRLHPNKVPEPCCIPTKHTPIQLLYFETEHRVVYKKYRDMVVEGCGCR